MNPDKLYEYLLEQVRVKDAEIFRLRVELAIYKAAEGCMNELELIPCLEQVQ